MINNHRQYPRRRADVLVLKAGASLKQTKMASSTENRYQVVVHVVNDVLCQHVFEKPSSFQTTRWLANSQRHWAGR